MVHLKPSKLPPLKWKRWAQNGGLKVWALDVWIVCGFEALWPREVANELIHLALQCCGEVTGYLANGRACRHQASARLLRRLTDLRSSRWQGTQPSDGHDQRCSASNS